jgi:PAS domain S-box-containing protein
MSNSAGRPSEQAPDWRLVFHSLPHAAFLLDANNDVIATNGEMERLLGIRSADCLGKKCWTLVHGPNASSQAVDCPCVKLAASKTPESSELYMEGLGASCLASCSPVLGTEGELEFIIHSITKIPASGAVGKAALREAEEERLRKAIDGMNAGTWEWNIQTGEGSFDGESAALLGYTLAELSPNSIDTWMSLKHPDDVGLSRELLAMHARGETESYSCETRMRHKDGSWVWIHARSKVIERDDRGEAMRMFGTHVDITKRKLIEEKLRESELKYRSFIEFSSDIVFCVDEAGRYHFANKVFATTFGKNPDFFIGKTFWDIYPKKDADRRFEIINKVFRTGASESFEIAVPINDDTLYFSSTANPIRDSTGSIVLVLTHGTDITKRKEAEEEGRLLLAEKESMLKEVHHRVKNNMGTMMSLLSLQAQSMADPAAADALKDAENRLRSMEVLYDKLYRSEQPREMSAKDYIPSLVEEIANVFPNRGKIHILTSCGDFDMSVKTMSTLGIILNEILTNAMKYAFVGRSSGSIAVSASKAGNRATIIVADDVVGLPESIELEGASGFGLSLIGALARQLGGVIRLERDKGTRFVLEFEE